MAHSVTNINLRGRLTQIIVLIALILAGVLLSQFANAQIFGNKSKIDKPKYRISVHKNGSKACSILHKKRNSQPTVVASNRSATKRNSRKPMAETEN
jgi:hypothetical protein